MGLPAHPGQLSSERQAPVETGAQAHPVPLVLAALSMYAAATAAGTGATPETTPGPRGGARTILARECADSSGPGLPRG